MLPDLRRSLRNSPALLGLALSPVLNAGVASATLPPDARKFLETLPGAKVSLDVVLARAIEKSQSFRIIQTSAAEVEVPYLEGLSQYDTRLQAGATRTDNRNEAETPFSPNRIESTDFRLSASRYFSTGTTAQAELSHGFNELGFPAQAEAFGAQPLSYYQTRAGVSLSQNLWQDAFGRAGRDTLRAGELSRGAAAQIVRENTEDWVLRLVEIFYGAWLSQRQVELAEANLKRRRRLLGITQLKLRRGTSETPDLLQVRSAFLASEVDLAAARQNLGDRWRGLVSTLALPEAWMKIDASEIPIALDDPVTEALRACASDEPPGRTATVERAELDAQAAELRLEAAKDALRPDLELRGSLFANGIDPLSRSSTFGETGRLANPAWTLGVQISLPLSRSAEKARALSAFAAQLRTEAQRDDARANLKLLWVNACHDLRRLEASAKLLEEAHQSQRRRAAAEEERFRIGRSSTLAVIQAGDDATLADSSRSRAEAERRLAAWRVRRLVDGFRGHLDRLKERFKAAAPAPGVPR